MNNNSHNYTIHDLSNLSAVSNNTLNSITNEEILKEIITHKKSVQAQKKLINNYKNDLQNNNDINNLIKISENNFNDQIFKLNEENKNLIKENKSLKKIIEDKDKLISEFEEIVIKSKEKYNKLQKINNTLKEEIIVLKKNNGGINLDMINKIELEKKKDNINNKFNNIQIQVNNSMNKSIRNSSNNNVINNNDKENEVDINENEKDKLIEKLNSQLIYIYNEYINLSNIIDKMNIYISNNNLNPNYKELKIKYDELMKENKLMKEKNMNKNKANEIEELKKELNNKDIELNKLKKNYEELFKNYQNTMLELKEKEKIIQIKNNNI